MKINCNRIYESGQLKFKRERKRKTQETAVYKEKNMFGRAFTIKQVGNDSQTEGQCNEAMVIGQGIYELE